MPLDWDKTSFPEGHSGLAFHPQQVCYGVTELLIYPHADNFLKSLMINKYPIGLDSTQRKIL